MEILVKPICQDDEERWIQLVREEQSGKRKGAYSEMHALSDVSSYVYPITCCSKLHLTRTE